MTVISIFEQYSLLQDSTTEKTFSEFQKCKNAMLCLEDDDKSTKTRQAAGRQLKNATVTVGASKLEPEQGIKSVGRHNFRLLVQLKDIVLSQWRSVLDDLKDGKIVETITMLVVDYIFENSTGWVSVFKELSKFSIRKFLEFSMIWRKTKGVYEFFRLNGLSFDLTTINVLISAGRLMLMAPKVITKTVDEFYELFDKYGSLKMAENIIELGIIDQTTNGRQEFIDGTFEFVESNRFSNSNSIIHSKYNWLYLISTKLSCEIYTTNDSETYKNLRIFLERMNFDKELGFKRADFKKKEFKRADFRLLAYKIGDTLFLATRGSSNILNW